jgi:NADH-ubiquinone oxidoreductase chain 1
LCWISLLPVAVAFIVLVPSILIAFDITPYTLIFFLSF